MSNEPLKPMNQLYPEIEELLNLDGPVMLIGQQKLKPTSINPDEKKDIIFPPSYAGSEKGSEEEDESGDSVYNIDPPYDPKDPATHKNVCVLDSIPSQANRMEPLFKERALAALVPQYEIKFPGETGCVNILDIGHRIADSAFRGTELRAKIVEGFNRYKKHRDARDIAKLGPTSLVFGVWDSRGTGVKIPRLVNSIIRAFEVVPLRRSAQYSPPINYNREGLLPEGLTVKPTKYGLAPVPAPLKIGGVQVNGEIRRDFSLNLELLRDLRATLSEDEKKAITEKYKIEHAQDSEEASKSGIDAALKDAQRNEDLKLQRYILGIALLAFTATQRSTLRQGCQLVQNGDPSWQTITAKGNPVPWSAPANMAEFSTTAANLFAVQQPAEPLEFKPELLKASIDADTAKKKPAAASSAVSPFDPIEKAITALEPSANGKKINKQKALEDLLAGVADGPVKALANSITSELASEKSPADKIAQIKLLLENAKANSATPGDSTSTSEPATDGTEAAQ